MRLLQSLIYLQTNQQFAAPVSVELTKLSKSNVIANAQSNLSTLGCQIWRDCLKTSKNFLCDLAPGRGESGWAVASAEDRRLCEGDLAGHVNVKQVDLPGQH